jgi:hypothetical protein
MIIKSHFLHNAYIRLRRSKVRVEPVGFWPDLEGKGTLLHDTLHMK